MSLQKLSHRVAITATVVAACAASLSAKSFANFEEGKPYRIVNHAIGSGSVAPGAPHGTNQVVTYTDDATAPDCYWYPEADEAGRVAFRNASTGQYLTFTEAKDYTTYVNLTLTPAANNYSYWRVSPMGAGFNLGMTADTDYFIQVNATDNMVSSAKGKGQNDLNIFDFVDSDGKVVAAPYSTAFVQYVDEFKFDGKTVPYDTRGGRFIFPVDMADGGTYRPAITFEAIDDAEYTLTVDGGAPQFALATIATPYTLALLRNGVEVASAAVELTNMPVFELTVENASREEYQNGLVRYTTLTDPTNETYNAELRWRGATAVNYPKHSWNVKFRNDKGKKLNLNPLGFREDNTWILDAMAIDRIRMRNRVCFDTWNAFNTLPYTTEFAGRNGTEGRFVEVILNGEYQGIYCFTDKINRALLDLKKAGEDKETGEVTINGVLYKSNLWDNTSLILSQLNESADMNDEEWNNWELQYPDDYPSPAAWNPLYDLYKFCADRDRFIAEWDKVFDRDNLVDFHLFVLALQLTDNGNKNMFISNKNINQADNRYLITPWDLDTSLGGYYDGRYWGGTYDQVDCVDMRINSNEPFRTMWNENLGDYRQAMAARWEALRNGAMSLDAIGARLAAYSDLFTATGAWTREWGTWQQGTALVEDLPAEINQIMHWYEGRMAQVDAYLAPYSDGIEAVAADRTPAAAQAGIYTLQGVRLNATVSDLAPGLYIVDGRKVAIR